MKALNIDLKTRIFPCNLLRHINYLYANQIYWWFMQCFSLRALRVYGCKGFPQWKHFSVIKSVIGLLIYELQKAKKRSNSVSLGVCLKSSFSDESLRTVRRCVKEPSNQL